MIKKILIAVVAIIVVFVIVVALQPAEFRVTRKATFAAAPGRVFACVNDLHKWQEWSPWAKIDPAAKYTYQGPVSGTGAGFAWAGNKDVGEGRMTIVESKPNELIRFKLEFIKPFAATSDTSFTFTPEGGQTVVTWTMEGKNNFLAKAFSLFMNCDKMVGGDFEKGLANLKKLAEAPAQETITKN